jgi:periplasmic protein TonB
VITPPIYKEEPVFEDSLFATNEQRSSQRGLTAVLSFGVQVLVLGVLVLVPLLYTDAIPLGSLKSYVEIPVPPGPRQPPPPTPAARRPQPTTSNFQGTTLLPPRRIPDRIDMRADTAVPPPPGPYIDGATGGSGTGSTLNTILASNMRPVVPPANIQPKSVRVSGGVIEGLLIHKVTPIYPKMAITVRQQGTVLLQAEIGRDGIIQNLRVVSGPPLLIGAALDAVKQWRYRPYLLNNQPVEVETQITVNFTLGG